MHFSRPRLTIRRLMILVAVAGLLLWSATVFIRWNDSRQRAEQHEAVAATLGAEIQILGRRGGAPGEVRMRQAALIDETREARRYRRAQARPWLSISSIPAEAE